MLFVPIVLRTYVVCGGAKWFWITYIRIYVHIINVSLFNFCHCLEHVWSKVRVLSSYWSPKTTTVIYPTHSFTYINCEYARYLIHTYVHCPLFRLMFWMWMIWSLMQPNQYVIGNSLQFLKLSVCAHVHVLQIWSVLSRDVVLFCQICLVYCFVRFGGQFATILMAW